MAFAALRTNVAKITPDITPTSPLYVTVGVTDVAAEGLRRVRTQAATVSASLTVNPIKIQRQIRRQLGSGPSSVLRKSVDAAGWAKEQHDALADRGEALIERIGKDRATQDLISQLQLTRSFAKGTFTTFRNAASRTESSTKATVTSGRRQAGRVADVISDVVVRDIKDVAKATAASIDTISEAATDATKQTGAAAKRTRTTARRGLETTAARAKAVGTVAGENAPRAFRAAQDNIDKVGDVPAAPLKTKRATKRVGPVKAAVKASSPPGSFSSPATARDPESKRTARAAATKNSSLTSARMTRKSTEKAAPKTSNTGSTTAANRSRATKSNGADRQRTSHKSTPTAKRTAAVSA